MDVERVIDDEVSVPHHGEVDGQVADVGALVVVLQRRSRERETGGVRWGKLLIL